MFCAIMNTFFGPIGSKSEATQCFDEQNIRHDLIPVPNINHSW